MMRIVLVCEGKTESALRPGLCSFLNSHKPESERVGIHLIRLDGPVARKKLARLVELELGKPDTCGVVALSDVYPEFSSAAETKEALRRCAGEAAKDARFRPHAAQFDVEAWIIPSWTDITKKLGVHKSLPGAKPEEINDERPPSFHVADVYKLAKKRYRKAINAPKWLTADRLANAADHCPELKLFLNSLLEFAGAEPLA